MLKTFGVVRTDRPPSEIFTGGLAPFIRLAPDGTDSGELALAVDDGIFRFVPDFMTKADWARHTQNVRAETVETRVTYRESWAAGHRCIIPAEWIFEPNYEADEHVRWRIRRADGNPMGIAGVYRVLPFPDREGRQQFAFSMLTVNADDHPFMKRFHRPEEEKRMVVILDPEDFEGWLTCPVSAAKSRYCKQWMGELHGEPAALPPRPKKPPPPSKSKPENPQFDLF